MSYKRPDKDCACGCGQKVSAPHVKFIKAHEPIKPFIERFWEKVVKQRGKKCWKWIGYIERSTGYGQMQKGRRGEGTIRVHVASFIIHKGPVPKGRWVLHTCDNRPCPNPDHLYAGTRADNIRDAVVRNRMPKGPKHWKYNYAQKLSGK